MNRHRWAVAVRVLLSVGCGPPLAHGTQTAAPAESQVRAALQQYAQLIEKMDNAGIAALFTEDGEVVNPGRDPIKGPAAIEAFLKQFSDYHVLSQTMIPQKTQVDGDHAQQEGTFKQRVRGPDGNVIEASGTFTIDWIRDSSGAWRIQRVATAPQR